MKAENTSTTAPQVATLPEREKICTIFDVKKTFAEALKLGEEVKNPLNFHIENKGNVFVVTWTEKCE